MAKKEKAKLKLKKEKNQTPDRKPSAADKTKIRDSLISLSTIVLLLVFYKIKNAGLLLASFVQEMNQIQNDYREKKAWGMVSSVDVYQCNPALISNPEKIQEFIIKLCEEIDMKRHGSSLIERFAEGELEGYSALQFIETSSITMHFDEQENRAFIDIFSCKFFDHKKAEDFCRNFLEGQESKSIYYLRY